MELDFLTTCFYHIGNFGPYILLLFTVYLLWNKQNLLLYYLVGYFFNSVINIIVKGIFQEPRPSDDPKLFNIALKNGKHLLFKNGIPFDFFGMPSGHTQCVFYSAFYILFALKNYKIFGLYLLFSLLVLYQRVYFEYHSIFQVIVGAIIGSFFAYFMYYISRKNIMGKLNLKKEDNGPL
jgi:membrane-associated phospholipid phosphatase